MQMPEMLDNVSKTVRDDLTVTIKKGDKLSVAAACFSIYAYQALKKQLDGISELHFIFTSPTFLQEKAPKAKREFYIPRLSRERSLYGTEFEVKLRNELTQKAIARECADWIRRRVQFRSNLTGGNISGFMNVTGEEAVTYMPLHGFTTADIGCERGNNIINPVNKMFAPLSGEYIRMFDQIWNDKTLLEDVTEQVVDGITAAYNENSPEFIYFVALYNIFNEFLEDISEDVLPNEATGFKESKIWGKLYDFQRDAALAIINKLEKYNGCILADSVGLGKTFTALAVIKYYELRNRMVLVLCPKKLGDNWHTFKENYLNNPIAADRLRYDVLYHTDLSRDHGLSGDIDLAKLNWGNYDLVVIDESHNFRNGGDYSGRGDDKRENRYLQLLNKVIRKGVKTKVLMLSATPVNNGFSDLRHQLELAYEGNPTLINDKLDTTKPIDVIFRNAQTAFNRWSKLDPTERTTESLLRSLDFDFFTLLDSVTIARSRKHIEKYYDTAAIGQFPERMKPMTIRPKMTDLLSAIDYDDIYDQLMKLNLAIYIPTDFLLESRRAKYVDPSKNIDRAGRAIQHHKSNIVLPLKTKACAVPQFALGRQRNAVAGGNLPRYGQPQPAPAFVFAGLRLVETVKDQRQFLRRNPGAFIPHRYALPGQSDRNGAVHRRKFDRVVQHNQEHLPQATVIPLKRDILLHQVPNKADFLVPGDLPGAVQRVVQRFVQDHWRALHGKIQILQPSQIHQIVHEPLHAERFPKHLPMVRVHLIGMVHHPVAQRLQRDAQSGNRRAQLVGYVRQKITAQLFLTLRCIPGLQQTVAQAVDCLRQLADFILLRNLGLGRVIPFGQ